MNNNNNSAPKAKRPRIASPKPFHKRKYVLDLRVFPDGWYSFNKDHK